MSLAGKNKSSFSTINHDQHVIHSGPAGVLFTDKVYLRECHYKELIELNTIKKIRIVKKEILLYNLIFFLSGLSLLLFSFLNIASWNAFLSLFTLGIVCLVFSFSLKKTINYFFVLKMDLSFMQFKIDNAKVKDAMLIVQLINENLNKSKTEFNYNF